MKSDNVKNIWIAVMMAAVLSVLSTSAFAAVSSNRSDLSIADTASVDHDALAHRYENMALAMQEKIQAQLEALSNKPRTSFFGRNGQRIKKHITYKINKYEKAARENMQKAIYHKQIAMEQSTRRAAAESAEAKDQSINKAGKRLDNTAGAL
ncbi:hypothetical protein SAMN05421690_10103 [Nitrosomonas sp. Nm51]|uniref:hypothetical protein n=1 Tax=Nitrosomonas sp. Nm51 TaxID=133720 RepID=UPI0008BD547E|nr:hypothetical protein [Nitrosomonas sp. Nm51]SER14755.1 hypothetical protein SAMN05421690_10103 [Nitrosomonas sp. Nm51]